MAYTITNPVEGYLPIASVDTGFTPPNSLTAIPTPPASLGDIVKATDPIFGTGEFILLKGVASTAVGSMVIYDGSTFTTALTTGTALANSGRPVAVAMAANTDPTQFAWYQVSGTAVVKKAAVAIAARATLGVTTTAGAIGASASGKQVLNARTANTATVASAVATINVLLERSGIQGRVT